MANVLFRHRSQCPPSRIRELLLDGRFLEAFVKRQHPSKYDIEADHRANVSVIRWSNDFGDDVPSLVKSLVGRQVNIELRINVEVPGRLDLDATAKRDGHFRAVLEIDADSSGSVVTISGAITVSGFMGAVAAAQASDSVIKPILEEELFPLLDEWCGDERGAN